MTTIDDIAILAEMNAITWRKYTIIPQLLLIRRIGLQKIPAPVRAQLSSLQLHGSILGVTYCKGLMTILKHNAKHIRPYLKDLKLIVTVHVSQFLINTKKRILLCFE